MSSTGVRLPGPAAEYHHTVAGRRARERVLVALAGLLAVGGALALALAMPKPNYPLVIGGLVGMVAFGALVTSPRVDITVGGLVFYLGCINGPLKLISSAGTAGSALQDVLIVTLLAGLLARRVAAGLSWRVPPLGGWVLAFVGAVAIEAFNPKTLNFLKVGAGFREQLQFVPFFLFAYLLVRSKARLRKAFLLLGVVALANGITATYQTRLSPEQAASWGTGYANKFTGAASRTFKSEGVGRIRPTGLGDESGAGAGVGLAAIAPMLALLAYTRRKRWLIALLLFGALAAVATGAGRIEFVGGMVSIVGYALLTASAGRRARRPLRYLAVALVVAIPFGFLFVSTLGEGSFARYSSLFSGGSTAAGYKENELKAIPHQIEVSPFGFGLGTAGPAAAFGGKNTELLEGHNVNAETTYNFLFKEVGLPGIIIWPAIAITMLSLAFRRIRTLADTELQAYLAAVFAPVFAMFFMAFEGPVSQSQSLAPYYWFAFGVAAYWLAGEGYRRARRPVFEPATRSVALPQAAG